MMDDNHFAGVQGGELVFPPFLDVGDQLSDEEEFSLIESTTGSRGGAA